MNAVRALVAMLLTLTTSAAGAQAPVPDDPFARDLIILSEWYAGEFDNEEQLWFENDRRSATPKDLRHPRIHASHRRVDLPAFGPIVFYVEEYRDDDPAQVIRQRLVTLASDRAEKAIRMRQGFFKSPDAVRGAHIDPSKLSALTAQDVSFLDGCDVFWRREADQFVGAMKDKACVFGDGDKRRYSVYRLVLSETKYWVADSTRLVSDDTLHMGFPLDRPIEHRRAKLFNCEIVFRRDDGSEQKVSGLWLHSQGGTVWAMRDATGERVGLRLRDKEYPYYETRPDFMFLAVRKPGQAESVGFSIHDSDSRRMGIDLGWFNAHCYRQGYTFRETLDQLPR
ncbi:MAG: chromophore lyase CpcT/CpeT [Rhodospirillaceae bacterium]|nr:chromophore lyase CpcT/CpeT [Rhodospirillaceae bacterium]